jgi:multiple sugar transport system ATP-binding protein
MAGVTLKDVAKRYGEVSVIEGLDLDIHDRELMVLVGPSGCGKSTALRMIAGLEDVSRGSISIGERAVDTLAPKERDVAMVFQSYALYPHMTVRENMEFGLRIRKTPREEMDLLVSEAADILDIAHLLDRKPRQLSGGQRQRVALGRAIVRKPAVFLFDEPLSNLDAKLRVQMRAEIKKLQQRLQVTSVYVTHDQTEAMTMGHRIAVMKGGRLQQVGTPLEVYERPANVFVAQFIGTPPMNFFPATLEDGGTRLAAPGFSLAVSQALQPVTAGRGGRRVVVGVRPDHLSPAGAPVRGPTASVEVGVELVEPLGNEVIVHARLAELPLVLRLPPVAPPEVGSRLQLQVELDALHLFDAETETRLTA